MINLTFLGTTSMIPTPKRNAVSMLLQLDGQNILIDCGEGTQRQLQIAKVSPQKISKIFITHWHGDHVLGLPGLLQTINSKEKNRPIEIYGPEGTKKFMSLLLKMFIIKRNNLKINIKELTKKSQRINFDLFYVLCQKLDHVAPCYGYSFVESPKRKINLEYLKKFDLKTHPLIGDLQKGKDIVYKGKKISYKKATYIKKGKKITFILDTKFTKDILNISKDSDILVCESTFTSDLKKKASQYKHLTVTQAAQIAKTSNSKKLILTHFSQRYKDIDKIKKEANTIFKNTICAHDFLKINL